MIICLYALSMALGVCSGTPFRGPFVPPVTSPSLVEGDIAVPESHLGRASEQHAFLSDPTVLWQRGYVPYRVDTFEWEGKMVPIFLDDQIANITSALETIMGDVPCIKFKWVVLHISYFINSFSSLKPPGRWQQHSKGLIWFSRQWVGRVVSQMLEGLVGRVSLSTWVPLNASTKEWSFMKPYTL